MLVVQPHMEERLYSHEMLWLTSVRPDGRPHSVPVWFLWENGMILVFSKPKTQKIRNVCQNSSVTIALDDTKQGVLVFEGSAELPEQKEGNETIQAYGEKYREKLANFGVSAENFTRLYSQVIHITPVRLILEQ